MSHHFFQGIIENLALTLFNMISLVELRELLLIFLSLNSCEDSSVLQSQNFRIEVVPQSGASALNAL